MPVYEYRCKNCAHQFDIQQSFSDDSLTVCPDCGQAELRKVFQPVGITFKGSGFYKNDSRSGSSDSGSSSTSTGSTSTDSPSTGSTSTDSPSSDSSKSTDSSKNNSGSSSGSGGSSDKPAAATPTKTKATD